MTETADQAAPAGPADKPGQLVEEAVRMALGFEDAGDRARAITGILKVIRDQQPVLTRTREKDVTWLNKTKKLSMRVIAKMIGTSPATVERIINGRND
jgi:hypothetical protein